MSGRPPIPKPRDTFNYYLEAQEDFNYQIRRVLLRAASQVDQAIAKAVGGNVSSAVGVDQKRMVLASLRETLAQLYESVGYVTQASRQRAAVAGIEAFQAYERVLLSSALSTHDVEMYMASAKVTSEAGINAVVKRMQGRSYRPLSYRVYRTEALSRGMVDRFVETALARGLTAREIAAGIAHMIDPRVRGGVSYAAMRLGRTEINNAFHAISQDRYRKSPYVTGVEWNLSTSHPEGDECDELADGGPYPPDAVPDKPHPMCFCYITPVTMSEDAFLDAVLGPVSSASLPSSIAEVERRVRAYRRNL